MTWIRGLVLAPGGYLGSFTSWEGSGKHHPNPLVDNNGERFHLLGTFPGFGAFDQHDHALIVKVCHVVGLIGWPYGFASLLTLDSWLSLVSHWIPDYVFLGALIHSFILSHTFLSIIHQNRFHIHSLYPVIHFVSFSSFANIHIHFWQPNPILISISNSNFIVQSTLVIHSYHFIQFNPLDPFFIQIHHSLSIQSI